MAQAPGPQNDAKSERTPNTSAGKWPSREELKKLMQRSAGQEFILVDNRVEGREEFASELRAQGAPPQAVQRVLMNFDVQPALVYPPQNGRQCLVSFQREAGTTGIIPPGSITEQLYKGALAGEFAKFAGSHESVHCKNFEIESSFGLARDPRSDSPKQGYTRLVAKEGVSEGVATVIYLKDAFLSDDSNRISQAMAVLNSIVEIRKKTANPAYELATELMSQIMKEDPNKIKSLADGDIYKYVLGAAKVMHDAHLSKKFP